LQNLIIKPYLFVLIFVIVLIGLSQKSIASDAVVIPDQCTLPVYSISLPQYQLDYLKNNSSSDTSFSAIIEIGLIQYPCNFSLRGATSRTYPKKSWNINFSDNSGYLKKEINLNAEYSDASLCRNTLAMILAKELDLDSPETKHISLFINNIYEGVYIEVEEVDEDYFGQRHLQENGLLIKASHHGGRFNPLIDPELFDIHYKLYHFQPEDLDSLDYYFRILQYGDYAQILDLINRRFSTENIIKFFAHKFAIMDNDGFTKNYYLYKDEFERLGFIPWDCDATFGNHWTGRWEAGNITMLNNTLLTKNNLFSRMIEVESIRSHFNNQLNELGIEHFPRLIGKVDSLFNQIRNDIYLDENKQYSNLEFENEKERLLQFLSERGDILSDLDYFHKSDIIKIDVNRSFFSTPVDSFHFQVEFEEEIVVASLIILDDENEWYYYQLDDTGINGDNFAGDGIWTVTDKFPGISDIFNYTIKYKMENDAYFYWPPSGLIGNYDEVPSFRLSYYGVEHNDILIGPIWNVDGQNKIITLINQSDHTVSLDGCFVTWGINFNKFQINHTGNLSSGDTLFLTNSITREKYRLPGRNIHGDYRALAQEAHEVQLSTSNGTIIDSMNNLEYEPLLDPLNSLIINEINYHGNSSKNPGDWIEVYKTDNTGSISGMHIHDANRNKAYFFTDDDDRKLKAGGGYLVVAEDIQRFRNVFPWVTNVTGNLQFSLSNGGEAITISSDCLSEIDYVSYDDKSPWPELPDGNGPTLELISPGLSNNDPNAWRPSSWEYPFGTPGMNNSVNESFIDKDVEIQCTISKLYPNPFEDILFIELSARKACNVDFEIFNILGQQVSSFSHFLPGQGLHTVSCKTKDYGCSLSSGVYFLSFNSNGNQSLHKVLLVK